MKIKLGSTKTGAAGTVRELICELEPSDPKDWSSSVGNWFIDAPGQSPAWRNFMMSAIHLRDIEGVKPAHIKLLGATHEIMIMAMDPAKKPDPENPETWSYLTPCNLSEQFIARDDAGAKEILNLCAAHIAAGTLWAEPALSGQKEPWRSFLRSQSTSKGVE